MFERVESKFSFNRSLRQGSVQLPDYDRRCPSSCRQTWKKIGKETNWAPFQIWKDTEHTRCGIFMWADNLWIMSHFKSRLEQMLGDLIQEAEKWDWHQSRQFGGGQAFLIPKRRKIFQLAPRQEVQDLRLCQDARVPRRKDTIRDVKDNRSKKRTVESEVVKDGGHVLDCVFSSGSEKLVLESWKPSTGSKDGKQRWASPFQKKMKMKVI